jgi:hypothetical protein
MLPSRRAAGVDVLALEIRQIGLQIAESTPTSSRVDKVSPLAEL